MNETRRGAGLQRRPTHLSVASLATNASALADSTISFGSEWSGAAVRISQFPAPPTEIPTPTLSTYSGLRTPTSPLPAIPSPTYSARSPPSPRSPNESLAGSSTHSTIADVRRRFPFLPLSPTRPLNLRKRSAEEPQLRPSISQLTIHPDNASLLGPRPPASPAATSSLYDWNDGSSGISISTAEERMLSTSFITSLLETERQQQQGQRPQQHQQQAQQDQQAQQKPPTVWNRFERQMKTNAVASGSKSSGQPNPLGSIPESYERRPAHQSIPASVAPHYLSEVSVVPPPLDSPISLRSSLLRPSGEKELPSAGSRPVSADYSLAETLHSEDEQTRTVVRTASFSPAVVSTARAVGVVPAYRISYNGRSSLQRPPALDPIDTSAGSIITAATTISPLPPIHRADAPQSVSGHGHSVDGHPRDSEDDYIKVNSFSLDGEVPQSPALPSTAGTNRQHFDESSDSRNLRQTLRRNQSLKSVVSSIVSRFSALSSTSSGRRAKYMAWVRKRPLPPLPPVPRNIPREMSGYEEIQKYEDQIPLPTLMKRAELLTTMLDDGFLPARSIRTGTGTGTGSEYGKEYQEGYLYGGQYPYDIAEQMSPMDEDGSTHFPGSRRAQKNEGKTYNDLRRSNSPPKSSNSKGMRTRIIVVCVLIIIIVAIAVPIAIIEAHKTTKVICQAGFAGSTCALNTTCVCTSTISGLCKPLAAALVDLVPSVNTLLDASFNESSLSDAVFSAQGQPPNNDCSQQALLIDVAPGLDGNTSPNRTTWAQSAILWNLAMSEDLASTTQLQQFVSKAPWSKISSKDGPVEDSSGKFYTVGAGYAFDFASQLVMPQNVTYQQIASPPATQLAELSPTTTDVLNRMYSFALASSTQRQKTLQNYWQAVLQQQPDDLPTFLSNIQSAPLILPFDATSSPGGQSLTSLMADSATTPFPPPQACYPSLTTDQVTRINVIETTVFGLTAAPGVSSFALSCFPGRPIYGVVDLLRLRLPFPDDRQGVGKQGAILSLDATSRAVIYSGEIASAIPGATSLPAVTSAASDPRQFGTTTHLQHVLLNYLSSISDVNLAMELVQFVLSGSSVPPSQSSPLFNASSALPILEFAVFGTVTPADISSSVSSLSTLTGSLFFGSDAGQTFRTWALVESSASVAWTESSVSPEIVRENAAVSQAFESVWTPASQLIQTGSTDPSGIGNVTASFSALNLFTPT